mgnify:CR=1 FL=1
MGAFHLFYGGAPEGPAGAELRAVFDGDLPWEDGETMGILEGFPMENGKTMGKLWRIEGGYGREICCDYLCQ